MINYEQLESLIKKCLTDDQMMRFAYGQLLPAEFRGVYLHMLRCRKCNARSEYFDLPPRFDQANVERALALPSGPLCPSEELWEEFFASDPKILDEADGAYMLHHTAGCELCHAIYSKFAAAIEREIVVPSREELLQKYGKEQYDVYSEEVGEDLYDFLVEEMRQGRHHSTMCPVHGVQVSFMLEDGDEQEEGYGDDLLMNEMDVV